MKKYFNDLLNNLDKLTGMKQLDKLMATKEPKKEINDLLDILCRVCNMFGYIPDEDKQRVISENIISDQEFIGLNAKIIFKWLDKAKGIYFSQSVEQIVVPADYKPLEGEERQKKITEWLDSLKGFQIEKPKEYGGTRLKSSLEELPVLEGYKKPDADAIFRSELHTQYIRENYEAISGKHKPTWISETEWIKQNNL